MEALSYLAHRRLPSCYGVSFALFVSAVGGALGLTVAHKLSRELPLLFKHGAMSLGWGALLLLAGALASVAILAFFTAPLVSGYLVGGCLRVWQTQGFLRSLVGIGISPPCLADGVLRMALHWWLVSVGPTLVLGQVILSVLYPGPLVWVLGILYLVLGSAGLFWQLALVAAWGCGERFRLRAVAFNVAAVVVPACGIGLMLPSFLWGSLASCLYVLGASRYVMIALFAHPDQDPLGQWGKRFSGVRKSRSRLELCFLPENAVAAREIMGSKRSSFRKLFYALGCFVLVSATLLSVKLGALWPLILAVLPLMLGISLRASLTTAQMISKEKESLTLDVLRATGISDLDVLKGWLQTVLRVAWVDSALLGLACSLLGIGWFRGLLGTDLRVLPLTTVAIVLPVLGAYLGAVLSTQDKPKEQILGQVFLVYAGLGSVLGPQLIIFVGFISAKVSFVVILAATALFVSILHVRTRRGLQRVLGPQP